MMIYMGSVGPLRPRAAGRRIGFGELPERVREWATSEFGSASVVAEYAGGMSPGCAATLATSGAGRIFIKAVGTALNPRTPEMFRQEIGVLGQLAEVSYRPALLASYDDGDWVGLALEHIPGRYPDLGSDDDFAAVAHAVDMQTTELTPAPAGVHVPSLAATARRWCGRWSEVSQAPHRLLPAWAADRLDELLPRVSNLPDYLLEATLCHFDIRDDNLLIRPNGEAVILDWAWHDSGRPGPTVFCWPCRNRAHWRRRAGLTAGSPSKRATP